MSLLIKKSGILQGLAICSFFCTILCVENCLLYAGNFPLPSIPSSRTLVLHQNHIVTVSICLVKCQFLYKTKIIFCGCPKQYFCLFQHKTQFVSLKGPRVKGESLWTRVLGDGKSPKNIYKLFLYLFCKFSFAVAQVNIIKTKTRKIYLCA